MKVVEGGNHMKGAFLWFAFAAFTANGAGPAKVIKLSGKYCAASAPEGWTVAAEQPAGAAFGADLKRLDGAAIASYLIVGVPAAMRRDPYYGKWYATPERAVMAQLTQFGTKPVSCGRPTELVPGSGYLSMACQETALRGLVVYRVFGQQDGGYVVLMRTAGTPHASWNRYGKEAATVARSLVCKVPFSPRTIDWVTDMPKPSRAKKAQDEGDSEYSPWLGMENYHDANTGQNYWVSPSHDWVETGPQGPGYYAKLGNEIRKLEPGVSQW